MTDCIITENGMGITNDGGIVKVVRSAIRNNRYPFNYDYLAAGIVNLAGQTA